MELVAMNTFPKTLNYPDITSFITVHYSKEKKERNKEKKKKGIIHCYENASSEGGLVA